jgi:hypothetical protein
MSLARIIQEAQQTLETYEPPMVDPVAEARAYFGEQAWREAQVWRETGHLPESLRGLELVGIDIKLEQEI